MNMTAETRAIDKIYRRRDRYEIPDWQRGEVWSRERKQTLIDSILRGWKLPKFYFLRLSDDEFEVVDGQQRLSAIFEFFSNELPLSKNAAKKFGAEYYKNLPTRHADTFDDFEIEFDLIDDTNEKDLKEFFQRLQQGLPLTSSEKLNSVHSKLRDFCRKIAEHRFLAEKVLSSNKRYGHFDIVAKVAAIEIEGLDVGLRYDELKVVFENQASFSAASNVGKRIKGALEHLDLVFRADNVPLLRNRSIVQSFITLVCRILDGGKAAGSEKRLRYFFEQFISELSRQIELGIQATDQDYIEFQRTVNANVKSGARIRHRILLRKLLAIDPAAADLFDPTVVVESGLTQRIKDLGDSVAQLVGQLNAVYSANSGEDLIKITNRTSQGLIQLGKPIRDFKSYETMIDDLYFLFHEGPGGRLGENKPLSFAEVNVLRTNLRHDLDHGDGGKVRAKRKKGGEVFKKYAGIGTPGTLSPERFPVVQANLLSAIEVDLRGLLKANTK
jgi:hypothetical protein